MSDPSLPVRIAIADDHQIFRDGLKRLLESEPGFEVVAEAADGLEALDVARRLHPAILLLDVAMPRMGGIEALAALKDEGTHVILLTASVDSANLFRAIQLGARGVVLKESATRLLIDGIHRVLDGKYIVGPGATDNLVEALKCVGTPPPRRYGLTARELDIVAAIVAGESNREIATRLAISLQTVKHHLTSIFDKTGASTRLELAMLAVRQGLVESA